MSNNIRIAYETLRAFDQCIRRDQGGTFRQTLEKVIPHIGDAYRGQEDGFRTHMGASLLGRKCDRELWYSFRWATKSNFSGQMLRLFNRGHLEEARFIALLLTAGIQVYQQDENGKQFRISEFGGHFGGSGDGVVFGVPDNPGEYMLNEYKTHNDKSFTKLAGDNWKEFHESILNPQSPRVAFTGEGVRSAKFEHWVQMQTYMRKMGLPSALYLAVNKNTDHIYAELVVLEPVTADSMIARAGRIIPLQSPPPMVNKAPGWYECKFCDHLAVCKGGIGGKAEPARNCRTCVHAYPYDDGTWRCNRPAQPDGGPAEEVLSKERQLTGCEQYIKNPNI